MYEMAGTRTDQQLGRAAATGSVAPEGGQAPVLFSPVCGLSLLPHAWFIHSLQQDPRDSQHGGSCEDLLPVTCKRWV